MGKVRKPSHKPHSTNSLPLFIPMKNNLQILAKLPINFIPISISTPLEKNPNKPVQKGSSSPNPPWEGGIEKHEMEENELLNPVICVTVLDGMER